MVAAAVVVAAAAAAAVVAAAVVVVELSYRSWLISSFSGLATHTKLLGLQLSQFFFHRIQLRS